MVVACCVLYVAGRLLFVVRCFPFVVCCLLSACYLSFAAYRVMIAVCCFVDRWLLLVAVVLARLLAQWFVCSCVNMVVRCLSLFVCLKLTMSC